MNQICPFCSKPVQPLEGAGRKKIYCSAYCRISYRAKIMAKDKMRKLVCSVCQSEFTGHFAVKYCSTECKQNFNNARNRMKKSISICSICGKEAIGSYQWVRKYCSFECQLKGIYGGKPPLSERSRKAQRNMRERNAPGLTYLEVRALRIKWQKEGRVCQYCQNSFDTIDHVVPLTRGGDNMLSNLVPCCRSCNSSKGTKTLAEWKPQIYA